MNRARPCRICRRWFRPHPRVGSRQRVCGSTACQRERHRRTCRAWHERNPGYDREAQLQRKLHRPARTHSARCAPMSSPVAQLDWSVVRDAVGLEVAVVVEESAKVLCSWARDAVVAQLSVSKAITSRHPPIPARDAMARCPP